MAKKVYVSAISLTSKEFITLLKEYAGRYEKYMEINKNLYKNKISLKEFLKDFEYCVIYGALDTYIRPNKKVSIGNRNE